MWSSGVLVELVLLALAFAQSPPPYRLRVLDRNPPSEFHNDIEVLCDDVNRSQADPEALFWLDRTNAQDTDILQRRDIRSGVYRDMNFGQVGVQFTITQDLEGIYTCGRRDEDGINVMESQSEEIVALPLVIPNLEQTSTTEFFAQLGDSVTILCPVQPGKLISRYFVSWQRNGSEIARFTGDPSLMPSPVSERYTIDQNYSLTISNVMVEDSTPAYYVCDISVMDGNTLYPYEQTRRINLTLTVDVSPNITSGPKCQAVSTASKNVTAAVFNCTASGVPPPSIVWLHNGRPTTNESKYATSISNKTNPDGRIEVNSTLTIKAVQFADNGNVACKVEGQESQADVAVLGKPDSFNVEITQTGNAILELRFQKEIPTKMQLEVTYTNAETNMTSTPARRDTQYLNTEVIRHEERSRDVPEESFKVMVRVFAEMEDESRIFGPVVDFDGEAYNKNKQTQCDFRKLEVQAIIVGVVFGIILIMVIVAIVFLSICYHKKLKAKRLIQERADETEGQLQRERIEANRQLQEKDAEAQRELQQRLIAAKQEAQQKEDELQVELEKMKNEADKKKHCRELAHHQTGEVLNARGTAKKSLEEYCKEHEKLFHHIFSVLTETDDSGDDEEETPVPDQEANTFFKFFQRSLQAGLKNRHTRISIKTLVVAEIDSFEKMNSPTSIKQ